MDETATFWGRLPNIEEVEPYATTFAACAIVWIVIQTFLQRRSVHADEARLARESAIFVHGVFGAEDFRLLRKTVGIKCDQTHDRMSDDTKAAFRAVLHNYGLIALAYVEGGVSAKVVERYWGSILVKDWARLEPFVAVERQINPELHRDTEALVEAVKKIKNGK